MSAASIDQLNRNLESLSRRLKLANTIALMSGYGLPLSKYWTWYQKNGNVAAAGIALLPTASKILVKSSDLPSTTGFMHSLDLSASSGNLYIDFKYSVPSGAEFYIKGHLSDFWNADFSPRNPASAGDPIVVNQLVDFPGSPGLWTARVSPSFNLPFNTPFQFTVTNDSAATITLYGYDFYFVMLTEEFKAIIDAAEAQGDIYGAEGAAGPLAKKKRP